MAFQVLATGFQVDDWDDTEIEISKKLLDDEKRYRNAALKEFEYDKNIRPLNSNILDQRKSQTIFEAFDENPQSIFMFNYENITVIGKKYISDATIHQNLPGIFCSKIQAPMLLGVFEREQLTQDGIIVFFKPFNISEKRFVFDALLKDRQIDIYYPYTQLLSEKKLEKTSPKDGWKFDKERSDALGLGEEELRKYTIKFLKGFSSLKGKRIFDPACSTGQFLSVIKKHYPTIYTIGQDLSPSMIEAAKGKANELHIGDSINSPVKNESVDFIFFRFINGEVVTTEQAYNLFSNLVKKVKKGGYIIIFGHSPVLVAKQIIENMGLKFIQANGVSKDNRSVFQYYVFVKVGITKDLNYKDLISNKIFY